MAAKLQDAQLQQIASRLKALRELSDYTIADAAGKLGVSEETYRAYEEAELDIPVSILHSAAELMGVDLTELLTGQTAAAACFLFGAPGQGDPGRPVSRV